MQSSTVPVQACSATSYAPRTAHSGAYTFLCLSNLPYDTNVDAIKQFLIQETNVKPKRKAKFKNNAAQFRYDRVEDRDHAFDLMQGKVFQGKELVVRKTADELRRNRVKAHTLELEGYAIEITNFLPKLTRKGSDLREVLLEKQIYDLSALSSTPFFLKDVAYLSFETEQDQEIAVQRLDGLVCSIGNPALRVTKREQNQNAKKTMGKRPGEVSKPESSDNVNSAVQTPSLSNTADGETSSNGQDSLSPSQSNPASKYSYLFVSNLPDKVNPVAVKKFLIEKTSITPMQKFKFKHNTAQFCYESEQDRDASFRLMQGAVFNGRELIIEKSDEQLKRTKMKPYTLKFQGYPIEITNFQPNLARKGSELREIFLEKEIYELSLVDKCPFFLRGVAYLSFRTEEDQKIAVQRLDGLSCAIAAPMLVVTTRKRSENDLISQGHVKFGEGGVLVPGRSRPLVEEGRTVDVSEESFGEEEDEETADYGNETLGDDQSNPPSPNSDDNEVEATSPSNQVLNSPNPEPVPEDCGTPEFVYSSTVPLEYGPECEQDGPFCICIPNVTVDMKPKQLRNWSMKQSKVRAFKTIRYINNVVQFQYKSAKDRQKAYTFLQEASWRGAKLDPKKTGNILLPMDSMVARKYLSFRGQGEDQGQGQGQGLVQGQCLVQGQGQGLVQGQGQGQCLVQGQGQGQGPGKGKGKGKDQSPKVPDPDVWGYYLLATNLPDNLEEKTLRSFLMEQDGRTGYIPQKKMRTNGSVAQFQFMKREGREKGISRLSGIQFDGKKVYLERTGDVIDNLQPRPKTIEGYGICLTFDTPVTQDGYLLKLALEKAGIFRLSVVDNSLLFLPHKAFMAFEKESFQESAIKILDGYSAIGLGKLRAVKQDEKFRETFISYVAEGMDDMGRTLPEREEEEESRGDEGAPAGGARAYWDEKVQNNPPRTNRGIQQSASSADFHTDDFGGSQNFQQFSGNQNFHRFGGNQDFQQFSGNYTSQYGMGNQQANFHPPSSFYQQHNDYSRGLGNSSHQYGGSRGGSSITDRILAVTVVSEDTKAVKVVLVLGLKKAAEDSISTVAAVVDAARVKTERIIRD